MLQGVRTAGAKALRWDTAGGKGGGWKRCRSQLRPGESGLSPQGTREAWQLLSRRIDLIFVLIFPCGQSLQALSTEAQLTVGKDS